jgi:parallel beta-helix repeat protein
VPLDLVLRSVEGARRLRLVILDACRDNPFVAAMSRAGGTRAIGRGLARVEPTANTLVAYAAKEGTTADDGEARNSPYSAALLDHLEEPGLEINMLFRRVRDHVVSETGARQEPFVYGSLSSEAFYLVPPSEPARPQVEEVAARPTGREAAFELAFWDTVRDSTNAADFEAYLERYPNGNFAPIAQNRLEELARTEVVVAVPRRPEIAIEVRDEVLIALRNANVRAGPGTDHAKLGSLAAGTAVDVTGKVRGADWYRIERPGGGNGYVYAPLLAVAPEVRGVPETVAVITPPPRPAATELHVEPDGGRDFRSIQAAIDAARPGTTIHVHPGIYREGLVIDKTVHIIGRGSREQITLEIDSADVVWFKGGDGKVANMTLRQQGGGEWYGIDISGGGPTVENVDVSSQSLANIAIRDGADPIVRGNRIHDGIASGVFVYDNGLGTVENNEIFANAYAGIEIKTGADPVVRGNRLHDGEQSGIYVNDNGRGTIENNEIYANAYSGIEITTDADPLVRGNRIHDGETGGIYVQDNGRGTIENNEIYANAYAGIEIATGADPVVRGNRIHDGEQSGIFVNDAGLGTVVNNDIYGNARAGIEIDSGGSPTVTGNRINRNGYEAIWVRAGAGGRFEDNDLRDNARGPWDIEPGAGNVYRANNQL